MALWPLPEPNKGKVTEIPQNHDCITLTLLPVVTCHDSFSDKMYCDWGHNLVINQP